MLSLISCEATMRTHQIQPKKLLSKSEMASLLADLHLMESSLAMTPNIQYQKQLNRYNEYELRIFKKYGIDSTGYKENYSYYAEFSEEMSELLATTFDTLLLRQMQAKKPFENKQDSSKTLKDSSAVSTPVRQ
jgi:hypothetical protein